MKELPLALDDHQTFVFMAALMGGVMWGVKPDQHGVVSGEDYIVGEMDVGETITYLLKQKVLAYGPGRLSGSGPFTFVVGPRSIE
jgi:hypothetical protein